jgi:ferredoxin
MEAVREHWADIGRSDALAFEYFGAPPVDATDAIDANITLKTGKQIQLNAGETLLDSLLENGETPKYGCKRGVCHECKCRKTSGAVKNLLTGKVTAGEEDIQLCISAPVSDVTLG